MLQPNPLPETDTLIVQPVCQDLKKQSVDTTAEFQSIVFPERGPVRHFFTSHPLKKIHPEALPLKKFQPDWIFGILLLCMILLAWTNFYYHKRLRQIFLAPYSRRFLNQLVRDGNLFAERLSVVLIVVYLLVLSLVLFEASTWFNPSRIRLLADPVYLYVACLGIISLYWVVKIILVRLLGVTFKTQATTSEYLLNVLIFNSITGLSILPFLVPAIYLKSSVFLYICIAILGIFILFRSFRGFLIGISLRKFSYLFLFVYLCSLEFLPVLILLKVFMMYTGTTIQVR